MNNTASVTETSPQPGPPDRRRQRLILSMVSGAVLLIIAVAILVYLGLRGTRQPSPATPSPTPTEQVRPTVTAFASPIPQPSCETIISSGNLEVSVALPVSLTVGGTVYPVEPIVPQQDAWTYVPEWSGKAVWVCGTVVNYVVGLEPTAENGELLGGLAPGDEISLYLTNGAVLQFRFAERRDVDPGADSVMAQQRPRLTLVIPETATWQVATADYAAEAEPMNVPPPATASAQLGEAVQVDQARVTLIRGYVERSDDLPPDTAYYLTEFSIQNVGDAALNIDTISVRLRDSVGNTYLASPRASEAGESGPLSEEIQPGASAQGSAGFLVPDPLPAGELIWTLSLRPESGAVSVAIPYEGEAVEDAVPVQPEVTVSNAFLSDDGNALIIEGEVRNRGTQPLVVEPSEIILSSDAGPSELITSAPLLPWTIEPGQSQPIELQYQKPDASTVLLDLLGYSFEVGRLQ